MAEITVYLGPRPIGTVQLLKDQNVIGRAVAADVRLEHVKVSRQHATVSREEGRWVLRDTAGKLPISVNGTVVKWRVLNNGDKIEIGRYLLVFTQSADDRRREEILARAPEDDAIQRRARALGRDGIFALEEIESPSSPEDTLGMQKTMFDPTLSQGGQAEVRSAAEARRGPHLIALTPMQPALFPIRNEALVIGSGQNVHVRLSGLTIAAVHVLIRTIAGRHVIQHVAGLAPVKAGGAKVPKKVQYDTELVRLADGDEIEIGPHRFRFHAGLDRSR